MYFCASGMGFGEFSRPSLVLRLIGLTYVRDDDTKRSDFGQPPVVANYFYHEEVKKSAKAKS